MPHPAKGMKRCDSRHLGRTLECGEPPDPDLAVRARESDGSRLLPRVPTLFSRLRAIEVEGTAPIFGVSNAECDA